MVLHNHCEGAGTFDNVVILFSEDSISSRLQFLLCYLSYSMCRMHSIFVRLSCYDNRVVDCDHEVCIVFKEKKINSFPLNFVSPSHLIVVVLVFRNPEEHSVDNSSW